MKKISNFFTATHYKIKSCKGLLALATEYHAHTLRIRTILTWMVSPSSEKMVPQQYKLHCSWFHPQRNLIFFRLAAIPGFVRRPDPLQDHQRRKYYPRGCAKPNHRPLSHYFFLWRSQYPSGARGMIIAAIM